MIPYIAFSLVGCIGVVCVIAGEPVVGAYMIGTCFGAAAWELMRKDVTT